MKLALLGPLPPDQLQLRAALRSSQPDADRFLGVLFGGVAPDEFFSPANLARIMGLAVA